MSLPSSLFDESVLWTQRSQSDRFYFQMKVIRTFEQKLLDLFSENKLFGTTHTCLGQEANAIGLLNAVDRDKDMVWSTHRCHGHFLAYCGQMERLFAEILGLANGVCAGRGGSQHLHWHNFSSSGVQAGFLPVAVGAAYAERANGAISLSFLGDGTLGEGLVYESLNLASLLSAPILFVVENNEIAQTTPSRLGVSGDIDARARAFGVRAQRCTSTDADEIFAVATELAGWVRAERKPAWLCLDTVRLGPHSKGDDTRSPEEVAALRVRDPLFVYRPRVTDPDAIDRACAELVESAYERALSGGADARP